MPGPNDLAVDYYLLIEQSVLRDIFVRAKIESYTLLELASVFGVLATLALVASSLSGRRHQAALLALSVVFVTMIDPLSALVLFSYAAGSHWLIGAWRHRKGRLQATAWSMILLMFAFKAGTTYLGDVKPFSFFALAGLSYYTFRIAALLLDAARSGKREDDLLTHLAYCFFFPIFVAGPIQRRAQFMRSDDNLVARVEFAFVALTTAIILKLFLGDVVFYRLAQQSATWAVEQESAIHAFAVGIFGLSRAFCDLQALTLMALGFGRLCGYQVPPNFNNPHLARNMADFWRRWHMTLTGWSRDYIFMPTLFLTRRMPAAVVATFCFMGIWHAPTLGWLTWGLGHALGILVHDALEKKTPLKAVVAGLPPPGRWLFARLSWLMTMAYVSIVFIAVAQPEFSQVLNLYKLLLTGWTE